MKKLLIVLAAIGVSACGAAGTAVETRVQVVEVPVRAKCPDATAYQGLKADRPTPLRSQPMPATAQERTAKTAAQLGRYEAPGGWGDRAMAALDRCQEGEELTPSP